MPDRRAASLVPETAGLRPRVVEWFDEEDTTYVVADYVESGYVE